MAYEGEELNFCPPLMFDFSKTFAILVSGDGPNKWGHLLLNTGGVGGNYFQIAGLATRPRYMDEAGYRRYLSETGKTELKRISVFITRPEDAQFRSSGKSGSGCTSTPSSRSSFTSSGWASP